MIKDQITRLANEENNPCVTISLNTHRTHPESVQDPIALKNLCGEAENRLIAEFGKRPITSLLEKLGQIPAEVNPDYNLDSLHVYLSNDTKEIIKSPWPLPENKIYISNRFQLRSLIKAYNRSEAYLILLLSQGGVHLYEALDDVIMAEIRNEHFPFPENKFYVTHSDKRSDSKLLDDMVREFLNRVDKALVQTCDETGLQTVVICTEDNYSRLMQVADRPAIYHGFAPVNYNAIAQPQIAKQAWTMIQEKQKLRRTLAIDEMKEAVSQGKVVTDLQEIFRAAAEGRGELLITHNDYSQPVKFTGDNSFDLIDDTSIPDSMDDIVSVIAWKVISKKGRALFTDQENLKDLGPIALKVRY